MKYYEILASYPNSNHSVGSIIETVIDYSEYPHLYKEITGIEYSLHIQKKINKLIISQEEIINQVISF